MNLTFQAKKRPYETLFWEHGKEGRGWGRGGSFRFQRENRTNLRAEVLQQLLVALQRLEAGPPSLPAGCAHRARTALRFRAAFEGTENGARD